MVLMNYRMVVQAINPKFEKPIQMPIKIFLVVVVALLLPSLLYKGQIQQSL
jgi:hypothetical protein